VDFAGVLTYVGSTWHPTWLMHVQLSAEGKVLRYLDDADGSHVATISAVTETADGLYLGNLGGDFVSFLSHRDLPPIA